MPMRAKKGKVTFPCTFCSPAIKNDADSRTLRASFSSATPGSRSRDSSLNGTYAVAATAVPKTDSLAYPRSPRLPMYGCGIVSSLYFPCSRRDCSIWCQIKVPRRTEARCLPGRYLVSPGDKRADAHHGYRAGDSHWRTDHHHPLLPLAEHARQDIELALDRRGHGAGGREAQRPAPDDVARQIDMVLAGGVPQDLAIDAVEVGRHGSARREELKRDRRGICRHASAGESHAAAHPLAEDHRPQVHHLCWRGHASSVSVSVAVQGSVSVSVAVQGSVSVSVAPPG